MASIVRKSTKVVPPEKKRKFAVYVVVRHTRAGDEQRAVLRVDKYKDDAACRSLALSYAEDIADEAALHYGQGSASAFKGVLTLAKEPEKP